MKTKECIGCKTILVLSHFRVTTKKKNKKGDIVSYSSTRRRCSTCKNKTQGSETNKIVSPLSSPKGSPSSGSTSNESDEEVPRKKPRHAEIEGFTYGISYKGHEKYTCNACDMHQIDARYIKNHICILEQKAAAVYTLQDNEDPELATSIKEEEEPQFQPDDDSSGEEHVVNDILYMGKIYNPDLTVGKV